MIQFLLHLGETTRERAEELLNQQEFSGVRKKLTNDPDGWEAPFEAGCHFLKLKEYQIAEECLLSALRVNKRLVFALANLAVCKFEQGHFDHAMIRMNQAASLLVRTEMLQQEKVIYPAPLLDETSIPLSGSSAVNLMKAIFENEKLPENLFDMIKSIDSETFYYFGNFSRKRGNYDVAIICFRLALLLDPKDFRSQTNLGTALAESGELEEALVELQKAVDLDPTDSIAHYALGVVYNELEDVTKAADHLQQAIALRDGFYPMAQKALATISE